MLHESALDKYLNRIDTAMTTISVIFIVGIILHNFLIMNFNNDFMYIYKMLLLFLAMESVI